MNTIITELAVIDILPIGLVLLEIADETDVETVIAHTDAEIIVADKEIPRF